MAKFIYKHRRGTTSDWINKGDEVIPLEGEIVIEIDTESKLHKLKIGDGKTPYSELKYLMAGDEIVTQVLAQALPRVVTLELKAKDWKFDPEKSSYKQTVKIQDGITLDSRLDLHPDTKMLRTTKQLDLSFVTKNNNDFESFTIYAVGDEPKEDYTVQATIVETVGTSEEEKVIGVPMVTPINIEGLKARVTNLEMSALGKLYETVEVADNKYTVQLPYDIQALPYGILSKVGGNISKIEVGLPYDISTATAHSGQQPCVVDEVEGSVIMPKGSKNYVYFKCPLDKGTVITVRAQGKNVYDEEGEDYDEVAKFAILNSSKNIIKIIADGEDEAIAGSVWLDKKVTLDEDGTYLAISKRNADSALKEDLKISNIRVIFDDPNQATIYGATKEIPEEVRNIKEYGLIDEEKYNYLDVSERAYHQDYYKDGDGVTTSSVPSVITDVSQYLPDDFDIIPVRPGSLVRFINDDGASVPYSLYYKTKITNTEQ